MRDTRAARTFGKMRELRSGIRGEGCINQELANLLSELKAIVDRQPEKPGYEMR